MADLRVLAHVSWREALAWPAPEFLAVVCRLTAYPGVLAVRKAEQERTSTRRTPARAHVVAATPRAIRSDRALSSVIEVVEVSGG